VPEIDTPRPRVLAVDDDPTVRSFVSALLLDAGYEVSEAGSGAEAVAACRAGVPDLILLDVAMPGMDGIATCAALRSLPQTAAVPIVMLTGSDDLEAIDRAFQAGATDFTAKSVHWLVLVERVRYLLRGKHAFDRLQRSEARLAAAERIGRLGYWEWDVSTGRQVWSEQTRRMLGEPEGVEPSMELWLDRVHPADRPALELALARAGADGSAFTLECRLAVDGQPPMIVRVQAEPAPSFGGTRLIAGTLQDVTERLQAEARIQRLAHYDELTGLPNRSLFRSRVQQVVAAGRRAGRQSAVLLMDLDDFKRVNDSLGHGAGDAVLAEVAARIARAVRESDIIARAPETLSESLLARHGGDEFAICLAELAHAEDAMRVAGRLLEVVAIPVQAGTQMVQMTASIGISVFPHDGQDAEVLLQHADAAMYHAKGAGRNTCRLYNETLGEEALRRLTFESDLRLGIERGEFHLCYQPIVRADTGRIVAAEALVRWHHPTRGALGADQFVPHSERAGLITLLGDWVLVCAARARARWAAAGHPIRMAVNASAQQLHDADLIERLRAAIPLAGPGEGALCIEITENALLEQGEDTLHRLALLRGLGVRIALDDFGTGYSSLSYLQRLPADLIKLDRSFVRGITDSPRDAAITAAVASMARAFGVTAVAEGIERPDQRRLLQEQGYSLMQGYLFGSPVPEQDLLTALQGSLPLSKPPQCSAVPTPSK
jgi:diguanylate cyclase (GGDEF)-like protein